MIKRLIFVLCLTLLLLALASVATTSAAPQAGNFGLQIKPGWAEGINPTTVARYAPGGMAARIQRLGLIGKRGPVGVAVPRDALLASGTLTNSCANMPYRYYNAKQIQLLGFRTGQYYTGTITDLLTISMTALYSVTLDPWGLGAYSNTFDYAPPAVSCVVSGTGKAWFGIYPGMMP